MKKKIIELNKTVEANLLYSQSLQLGNLLKQSSLGPTNLGIQSNRRCPIFLFRSKLGFLQIKITQVLASFS